MGYSVEYSKQAIKSLKKLDKSTKCLIVGWIEKNLIGCENLRIHGKPLTANRNGQWCYRIGDYRINANIVDEKIIIVILNIGHRREIFNM